MGPRHDGFCRLLHPRLRRVLPRDPGVAVMTRKTETGGPAFPQYNGGGANGGFLPWEEGTDRAGMSLRDYFAAKAMQGLLAHEGEEEAAMCAEIAYAMADAMIAARGAQ